VIQAIQSSVCKAEAPKNGFQKMGDQKIELLCLSWWSLLLVVFLFGPLLVLLIRSIQQHHAGLEFDSKG
jgi:ABC-type spermidine/putrescine transport system permease subunit II